jgi:hypothetical protein
MNFARVYSRQTLTLLSIVMSPQPTPNAPTWIAFTKTRRIARGPAREVAAAVKAHVDGHPDAPVLVLDAVSSRPVEIDLRGSLAAVLKRLPLPPVEAKPAAEAATEEPPRGPGRPKLGVVAREVTLLPRHWDWLASQPGGASVVLRKLVERALRASVETDRLREATESAYRFMHHLAGNEAGFEEASRALFAGDFARLKDQIAKWPRDVRSHLLELVDHAAPVAPADAAPLSE